MRTHVQVLAWLHIAFGILVTLECVAIGLFVLSIGHDFPAMPPSHNPADNFLPADFNPFRLFGLAILKAGLVLGMPGIIMGVGLLRFPPWARIFGIVVSILEIVSFMPLYIALGVYGLVILCNKETAMLFRSAAAVPPPVDNPA